MKPPPDRQRRRRAGDDVDAAATRGAIRLEQKRQIPTRHEFQDIPGIPHGDRFRQADADLRCEFGEGDAGELQPGEVRSACERARDALPQERFRRLFLEQLAEIADDDFVHRNDGVRLAARKGAAQAGQRGERLPVVMAAHRTGGDRRVVAWTQHLHPASNLFEGERQPRCRNPASGRHQQNRWRRVKLSDRLAHNRHKASLVAQDFQPLTICSDTFATLGRYLSVIASPPAQVVS